MWKKPLIAKPDFQKVNLEEMTENELLELNGGLDIASDSISTSLPIGENKAKSWFIKRPIWPPIRLSGMIAQIFDFTNK